MVRFRSPSLGVSARVRSRAFSRQAAREIYRVAVDPQTFAVDEDATEALRKR